MRGGVGVKKKAAKSGTSHARGIPAYGEKGATGCSGRCRAGGFAVPLVLAARALRKGEEEPGAVLGGGGGGEKDGDRQGQARRKGRGAGSVTCCPPAGTEGPGARLESGADRL